jgi:putative transposase
MIDRNDDLPVSRQAKVVGISRGSVYYRPRTVSADDLALMRRIDELHLDYPFAGSRMLQTFLVREGYDAGRLHVATLMKRMGIEAIYRRPNTSKPAPGHTIFPYLLRKLPVTRPNQVWAMDITYIPMARGFVYLAAVVDWFSRKVLAWKLSITLETEFCLEAVEEALARYGKPEIFNTDQGSQFTSIAFTGLLLKNEIKISMDGKGAWRDNMSSGPGELHPQALTDPDVSVSTHPAPTVQPVNGFALSKGSSRMAVDLSTKPNSVAPSLQRHYSTFITTTRNSAPVLRIGTRVLVVLPLEHLP